MCFFFLQVRLHEFHEGAPSQKPYFVELWDIGGNNSHKNARHVFYKGVHGIILVHDLTNRKSKLNLKGWLSEVLAPESGSSKPSSRGSLTEDFDVETFSGYSQIPVLVVGSKQDLVAEIRNTLPTRVRLSSIAEKCHADEIYVNCEDIKTLSPGSSSSVKLS